MPVTAAIALTYRSPADDAGTPEISSEDLARLVEVASTVRTMAGDQGLYADVRMIDGTIRFVVELDPLPTYGASSVARGLVTRAISEAGTPTQLEEISCENVAV